MCNTCGLWILQSIFGIIFKFVDLRRITDCQIEILCMICIDY